MISWTKRASETKLTAGTEGLVKLGYLLGKASGTSRASCHFLVLRFDERWGFKPDVGDSWVFQGVEGTLHSLYGGRGWFTDLWRSPTGRVYVSDSASRVHINNNVAPMAEPWRMDIVPGVLSGIWGLNDNCVFTWGSLGDKEVMYRWDGQAWKPMESPGHVIGMHGIAPDFVYAVGDSGLIARWDGSNWTQVPSPTRSVLSSIYVASPEEMYSVGAGRRFLEGSIHGWTEVCEGPSPMYGVAKFKDEVWVAASDAGLMKREGAKLVSVKPNILADRFDSRGNLLISAPGKIAETADGAKFVSTLANDIIAVLEKTPPAWVK